MPVNYGLDFETYSNTDITKHGLDRYLADPDFTPLIGSTSTRGSLATYDFINNGGDEIVSFLDDISRILKDGERIAAHNVGFERGVLRHMGMNRNLLYKGLVDSAVVARAMGASSHLEAAAPQLVNIDKLAEGKELIRLFSIPNDWNGGKPPTWDLIRTTKLTDWLRFQVYCERDADASYMIARGYDQVYSTQAEHEYERLTARMNDHGWRVDLAMVEEMQLRYQANVEQAVAGFRARFDPSGELNFNSSLQLQRWCAERGIKAKSFDEEHVGKLVQTVGKKLDTLDNTDPKYVPYSEVHSMLITKKILGGSSLKKLQTILDQVGPDGRLRNQYMHVGASQSFRTSGRGVQMQNLKRLSSHPLEMDGLLQDATLEIDNEELAENLRQVFTSSHPQGELVVGDFSSVESRGLAWLAGAEWKLDSFRQGLDMYKVLAGKIYGIPYDQVDKTQRQTGKVGELSCGYGAGPVAVVTFAKGMHVEMSEADALSLVRDWRAANPEIVELWEKLDAALHRAVEQRMDTKEYLAHGLQLRFEHIATPDTLLALHPGAQSIKVVLLHVPTGTCILERVFHGMYSRGRNICYYKPSERKTGDLWLRDFVDPKTKQRRFYDVYGGKLVGILTQSFCRELFFTSLDRLYRLLDGVDNAAVVGQFHDEIVVDWQPGDYSLQGLLAAMQSAMSYVPDMFSGFPLEADIKHAYRYIK